LPAFASHESHVDFGADQRKDVPRTHHRVERTIRRSSATAIAQPLLDETADLVVLSQRKRLAVALGCVGGAAEPSKHVRTSQVKRPVLLPGARALDIFEQSEAGLWANGEGDGGGPVDR
jgi:hypothetical protein